MSYSPSSEASSSNVRYIWQELTMQHEFIIHRAVNVTFMVDHEAEHEKSKTFGAWMLHCSGWFCSHWEYQRNIPNHLDRQTPWRLWTTTLGYLFPHYHCEPVAREHHGAIETLWLCMSDKSTVAYLIRNRIKYREHVLHMLQREKGIHHFALLAMHLSW